MGGIEQAMVVPVPDREFGFRPVAFIKTTRTIDQDTIVMFLQSRLPRFKIPIKFWDWPDQAAPQGIKVSRRQMQQLASTYANLPR
jgi:O-succinylbenzoic acid--CoA ligase